MSEHGESWEMNSKADATKGWALQVVTFEQLFSTYKSFVDLPTCACGGLNDVTITARVDGTHW